MARMQDAIRPCALVLAETLIHVAGRLLVGAPTDQNGGHSGRGAASRDGVEHNAAGPDLGAFADLDVAEDSGAGSDHNAFAYLRVAVADILAGTSKGYALKHGD